jgi:hypothetical protein
LEIKINQRLNLKLDNSFENRVLLKSDVVEVIKESLT